MPLIKPIPLGIFMTLCLNGVGLVWVSSVTFIFICCNVIENPHSYIPRIHGIIIISSSCVNTIVSPIFPLLVLPFKWSKRELGGMFQDLFAFFNECVPFSIASMASSNVWFVQFPFFLIGGTLLITWHVTRSQVTGWNPLEGSTKSSCGKLKLGGTLPASNSRKG